MTARLTSRAALVTVPPAVPPSLVRRPRLEERLSSGTSRPLTLVSSGPGSGKTLAVASWIAFGRSARPVAWLTVGEADNDLWMFWSDVLDALRASDGVPPDSLLRDMVPANGFGATEISEILAALADLPGQIVLVLDEFEAITDPIVLNSLGRLFDPPIPTVRTVLITRSDPVLRLHRMRMSDQLAEIRTGDLAFSEAEAAALFDLHGLRLTESQRETLLINTQGWPAGLRLAAMSLDSNDIEAGIARFSGSERSVADYLTEELLDRLDPPDRGFLLSTCVCDVLSGELADHLTGRDDGQLVLEKLVGANALVVDVDGRAEWFAFHPLLRELLRHRLALEQPGEVRRLHRLAARWQAARSELISAIRHAIAADDLDLAGEFLITALPRVLSPQGPRLAAAIRPLAARADARPDMTSLLAAATVHFHRHEFAAMQRDATEATDFLDAFPDNARAAADVAITMFQVCGARARGDAAACIRESAHAIDVLDGTPHSAFPAHRAYRVTAVNNVGVGQLWMGDFVAAEAHLIVAEQDTTEYGLELGTVNAAGHLALIDALHGRCVQAHQRALPVLDTIRRRGWASEPQALACYLALALVELSRNRLGDAGALISRALAASVGQTDRCCRLAIAATAVAIAVAQGDTGAIRAADARLAGEMTRTPAASDLLRRWSRVARAEALLALGSIDRAADMLDRPGTGPGLAASWERVTAARIRLASGDVDAAAALAERVARAEPDALEPAVDAHLLLAVIADRLRRDTSALAALGAALELAEGEDLRRPFLRWGGRITGLIVSHQHVNGRHRDFATGLLAELAPGRSAAAPAEPVLVEHLTERELIVLSYLPTMLKAGEIGADLYVSVNTVKAHLRSIYRKFDVTSRREAVERARAAGLL